MGELRKHYVLDEWVLINEKRNLRPQRIASEQTVAPKICFFCKGNEKLTPKELGRVEEKGSWKIRWFPNKFPVYTPLASFKQKRKGPLLFAKGTGYHEVIVETDKHDKQLWDLSTTHIKQLLKVYQLRIKALSKKKNVKYVCIFKNHGKKGGASIDHSHTQIVTVPFIPPRLTMETDAIKKSKSCQYCKILAYEKKSKRFVADNKSCIAFTPFASRFNYEVWLFAKNHNRSFIQLTSEELHDLAELLQKVLKKLKTLNLSYNFFVHYSPSASKMHFHIEITPRKDTWAGFEFASNIIVNSVSPESAAKFYRK